MGFNWTEFWELVLGDLTSAKVCAYALFSVIGIVVHLGGEVKTRNKESKRTPKKFKGKFFVKDNLKRWIVTVLLLFVLIRFYKEFTGQELVPFTALLLGFSAEGLSGFAKRKIVKLQSNNKFLE